MPRRLRIEFPDAIYHVMARGNARQDIVTDDDDHHRILADLGRVAHDALLATWLCRRHAEAPLHELVPRFGLSRAGSVPTLTRRIEARLATSPRWAEEMEPTRRRLMPPLLPSGPIDGGR